MKPMVVVSAATVAVQGCRRRFTLVLRPERLKALETHEMAKDFPTPDPVGMKDYFEVYSRVEPEVNAWLLDVCRGLPGIAELIDRMSHEQLEEQRALSLQLLRRAALEADWAPLLEFNRVQGSSYASLNISLREWFELVSAFQKVMVPHLTEAFGADRARLNRVLAAMYGYLELAMATIGEEYLKTKEKIILRQAQAIQELSTPVLKVRNQLLLIPLVGTVDSHRARELTSSLLTAIRQHRAKAVVIDITGVAAVDSKVADHLFRTIASARLMGAQCVITGVSSDVAEALVALGVPVSQLNALGDLQDGLEEGLRLVGSAGEPPH